MDRQRLMPDWAYTWRTGAYSTMSHGWRVGPFVWIGGQVALDGEARVVHPGDMGAQTRYVYEAIKGLLAEAGGTMRDVVKITTYLALDPADPEFDTKWEAMAEVRKEYFPEEGPGATGIAVWALRYPGLLVEVEAMAVLRDGDPE
jgi:enamine deaminase RidA (YjgF/YER057c/UK114 family)